MRWRTVIARDTLVSLINLGNGIWSAGFILIRDVILELAEVQSVAQAPPQAAPVPSKKIDEKAFFDVSRKYFY